MVTAPTRWKLRKAVRIVNQFLEGLKVEKHPDKTFIGKKEKGFTFLSYFITPEKMRLGPAQETLQRHLDEFNRLYGESGQPTGNYQKRWFGRYEGGLKEQEKGRILLFPLSLFLDLPAGKSR